MEFSDGMDARMSTSSLSNHAEPKRWYHDWTGSTFIVGDRTVQLSIQLSERNHNALGQCVAVVLGNEIATNELVVLKIRYESVPILNCRNSNSTNPSVLD